MHWSKVRCHCYHVYWLRWLFSGCDFWRIGKKWGRWNYQRCIRYVHGKRLIQITLWITILFHQRVFAIVGKFGVSGTFGVIYVHASELYPTPIRSIGKLNLHLENLHSCTRKPAIQVKAPYQHELCSITYARVWVSKSNYYAYLT